jgi:transcriptional regulator with XRE-family HTH domain
MIGKEVRRHRQELRLTGAQLAARAGMAPSAVSQIETGKRTPSSTSVMKLAEALGVEVAELFPKSQAPLPLDTPDDEEAREWRLLGYVRSWTLLLDDLSERWEKAAAEGTFSLDTYDEHFATFIDVQKAVNSLIEGLKRHEGVDAMQGAIGHRFRQSLLRSAGAASALSETAIKIYGANELGRIKRTRQAAAQHNIEAYKSAATQDAHSRGAG